MSRTIYKSSHPCPVPCRLYLKAMAWRLPITYRLFRVEPSTGYTVEEIEFTEEEAHAQFGKHCHEANSRVGRAFSAVEIMGDIYFTIGKP